MTTIINITHEVGDLTEYSSTATDGGNLSVTAGAAMVGTRGLAALINDTTTLEAFKDVTKASKLRYRLYFDPNTLTMASGDSFSVVRILQNGGGYSTIQTITLGWSSGGGYVLYMNLRNDANAVTTDSCSITDAPHYIEVYETIATGVAANDGTFQWWVDGADQGAVTGIDNYNRMGDQNWSVILTATGMAAGTSGTLFFDDLKANDDGGTIGAEVTFSPAWAKNSNVVIIGRQA
jgi:hypothetical protein